jgi:hypothetical protein
MRRGTRKVGPTITSGSQDSLVRSESVERSILHVEREHTDTFTVLHEQVERKVFDEEVGVVAERLAVEGVKNGVTRSVGGGGAPVSLSSLSELERLSTKGSLVDLALLGTREWDTKVLELYMSAPYEADPCRTHLDDSVRCLSAHVMDSILVSEPIRSLDGIVPSLFNTVPFQHRQLHNAKLTCAISSHPPSCFQAQHSHLPEQQRYDFSLGTAW